jgi:hypothetical protein
VRMNLVAHYLPFLKSSPPSALRALGLAAVLAILGAAPAQAVTRTDYDVTIEGAASYSRADSWPTDFGAWEWGEHATFKWRTKLAAAFLGNQVVVTSNPSTSVTQADASLSHTVPTAEGPRTGACTGNSAGAVGNGWLAPSVISDPTAAIEIVDIRVLGSVELRLPSCTGLLAGQQNAGIAVTNGGASFPTGPFDTTFDMPHEAIGMGKIIQLLDDVTTGTRCPGYRDGTVSCTLSWKATVTFVRTAQQDIGPIPDPDPNDDDLVVPLPGPDDDLVVPLPGPDDDLIVPLRPRGKLSPRADRARVALQCKTACSGRATAYAAGRRDRGSAAPRALARARFTGAPARATTVSLRFRPPARREARRAGGVRVVLEATPRAGGATVRKTVLLRLPLRSPAGSSSVAPQLVRSMR